MTRSMSALGGYGTHEAISSESPTNRKFLQWNEFRYVRDGKITEGWDCWDYGL